ncbi:hypothetical protein Tco_1479460, partial [Tanacetum coccineum]
MHTSVKRIVVTSSLATTVYNARLKTSEVVVNETWFSDPQLFKEMKVSILAAIINSISIISTLNSSAEEIAQLLNGSETYPKRSRAWVNVQDITNAIIQVEGIVENSSANG